MKFMFKMLKKLIKEEPFYFEYHDVWNAIYNDILAVS